MPRARARCGTPRAAPHSCAWCGCTPTANRAPATLRGHPLRLRRLARIPRREDAEQARHPGLRHARQHVIQVGRKHRVGQMTVGVDHYR